LVFICGSFIVVGSRETLSLSNPEFTL